jgi:HPr kinase/phosphorylase
MQEPPNPANTTEARTAITQLHGVQMRVFETGVFILGESGIGKSECALDLISTGHQLVADDAVQIRREGAGIVGSAPPLTRKLIEIRGLGILNICTLFGDAAYCEECKVDLCIELTKDPEVDRLGTLIHTLAIEEATIPKFVLPVTPGRNLATLVETAARMHRSGEARTGVVDKLLDEHAKLLAPLH